jgi:hypothetical protein
MHTFWLCRSLDAADRAYTTSPQARFPEAILDVGGGIGVGHGLARLGRRVRFVGDRHPVAFALRLSPI